MNYSLLWLHCPYLTKVFYPIMAVVTMCYRMITCGKVESCKEKSYKL